VEHEQSTYGVCCFNLYEIHVADRCLLPDYQQMDSLKIVDLADLILHESERRCHRLPLAKENDN